MPEWLVILLIAVAAIATAVTQFEKIVSACVRAIKVFQRRRAVPVLLDLKISDALKRSSFVRLREDSGCLMQISVAWDGNQKVFIRELELRHFAGNAMSIPTGRLESAADYRFTYHANQHLVARLEPPLLIDPSEEPTIYFQIEIAPEGRFASGGGSVFAKLNYQFEDGTRGSLALVDVRESSSKTVKFPMFETNVIMRPQFEEFHVSRKGNIIGKNQLGGGKG